MFNKSKKDAKPIDVDIKEWFIIVDNQHEGPFNMIDLKRDRRFTPDTLVWKKGFKEWTPARFVVELKEVFKDEPGSKPTNEPEKGNVIKPDLGQESQVTLTMQQDPYQLFLWILVLLLMIFYTFYQLYYK